MEAEEAGLDRIEVFAAADLPPEVLDFDAVDDARAEVRAFEPEVALLEAVFERDDAVALLLLAPDLAFNVLLPPRAVFDEDPPEVLDLEAVDFELEELLPEELFGFAVEELLPDDVFDLDDEVDLEAVERELLDLDPPAFAPVDLDLDEVDLVDDDFDPDDLEPEDFEPEDFDPEVFLVVAILFLASVMFSDYLTTRSKHCAELATLLRISSKHKKIWYACDAFWRAAP